MKSFIILLVTFSLFMRTTGYCAAAAQSTQAPSAKNNEQKQATPALGDKSDQPIAVNTPYCDAYFPYAFSGPTQDIQPVITSSMLPTITDPILQGFLGFNQSTSDAIASDGSFKDPGYPIFGDPKAKLMADGSDLTRLLTRLVGIDKATGKNLTQPLCKEAQSPSPSTSVEDSEYILIHIVRWKLVSGMYQTDSSNWYVFNKSDKKAAHRQFPFTFHPLVGNDLRIFGSAKVFFLAIHLAPTIDAISPADNFSIGTSAMSDYDNFSANVKISYTLKVTGLQPANIQDLKALIGVIVGSAPAAAAAPAKALAIVSAQEVSDYRAFLSSFGSRPYDGVYTAAKLTNLKALPNQITATMNATLPKSGVVTGNASAHFETSKFWDDLKQTKIAVTAATPATVTTSGCSTVGNTGTCPESLSVHNEGLAWWDVSVGIPFKGIKQLSYDYSNTGQVTTSQAVSKYSAYGFLMLAPWKEDIVNPPSLGFPHFLIGLPFTGSVLNHPFVGAGETFNLSKLPRVGPTLSKVMPLGVRFYAGLVENKEYGPKPSSGNTAPPSKWVGKLQVGIEFSIKDIASKLSSSTKPSSTSQKK